MEEVRVSSKLLHPEVLPVSRDTITTSLETPRTSLPYFSKYEHTALVYTRAQQLADGAKPLVSLDGLVPSDPQFVYTLAMKEIAEQKLPYIIHRRFPDGRSEYWNAMELTIIW
jgi:DNA-directed RNA polymerase I, II, and III subunit RPABC2